MKNISITRALSELKLLDQRIEQATRKNFIGITTGKFPVRGYDTQKDFDTETKGNLQRVESLIKERQSIKSAIVLSNAKTNVVIGGNTMTVAEAIEQKQSIVYRKNLLNQLSHQVNTADRTIKDHNRNQESKLQSLLETMYGKATDRKDKNDNIEATTKSFWETQGANAADPCKLNEVVEKLSDEINAFESEVDFTLVESNTVTKIEVAD